MNFMEIFCKNNCSKKQTVFHEGFLHFFSRKIYVTIFYPEAKRINSIVFVNLTSLAKYKSVETNY